MKFYVLIILAAISFYLAKADEFGAGEILAVTLQSRESTFSNKSLLGEITLENGLVVPVSVHVHGTYSNLPPQMKKIINLHMPFSSTADFYKKVLASYCTQKLELPYLIWHSENNKAANYVTDPPIEWNASSVVVSYQKADHANHSITVQCL